METLLQDLRYGIRLLLKHPGFTLVAVATLAIGIGANTAIFSIVNAVLLRPFPFPQPDQIVMVTEDAAGNYLSYPNFADWKDERNLFASTSAVRSNELQLYRRGRAGTIARPSCFRGISFNPEGEAASRERLRRR